MFKVCAAIVSLRLSPVHAAEACFMFTHVQRDFQTRLSWLCPAPRWAVMGRATDGHYKLVSIRCIKRDSAPSGLNQNAENKEQIDSGLQWVFELCHRKEVFHQVWLGLALFTMQWKSWRPVVPGPGGMMHLISNESVTVQTAWTDCPVRGGAGFRAEREQRGCRSRDGELLLRLSALWSGDWLSWSWDRALQSGGAAETHWSQVTWGKPT